MAEFQEVMRQAKRMCEANCEECPLSHTVGNICPIAVTGNDEIAEIERIVMDWAAKNPEPRYPSWHEAWKQLFPDGQGSPCPSAYGMKYEPKWCGSDDCKRCKNRPIPADIAEKLGIKPIGGGGDA